MNGMPKERAKTKSQQEASPAAAAAAAVAATGADAGGERAPAEFAAADNVNVEATQKYIQILEDKIKEYSQHLLETQMEREAQTAKAIEQLNICGSDSSQQERTKKKLQKEQAEFTNRMQNIQKNIHKLEFKLGELRLRGIPKQVVPDDYVRQLKRKEAKKLRKGLIGSLPRSVAGRASKTPSSSDLLAEPRRHAQSDSPQRAAAKSLSLEPDASLDAGRESIAHSDRYTFSSSEAAQPKKASLPDEDNDRLRPAGGRPARS